jgi:hypothetical protein
MRCYADARAEFLEMVACTTGGIITTVDLVGRELALSIVEPPVRN